MSQRITLWANITWRREKENTEQCSIISRARIVTWSKESYGRISRRTSDWLSLTKAVSSNKWWRMKNTTCWNNLSSTQSVPKHFLDYLWRKNTSTMLCPVTQKHWLSLPFAWRTFLWPNTISHIIRWCSSITKMSFCPIQISSLSIWQTMESQSFSGSWEDRTSPNNWIYHWIIPLINLSWWT